VVHRARFNFFSEAQIWYDRRKEEHVPGESYENVIVLSEEFFNEVTSHPIPTDLEAVKLLSPAPAVLDLFVWLSYRCFTAKGTERIPIFGPFGLVQQLGAVEYSRPRKFRQKLHQWLRTIQLVWPECPAQITEDGESLRIDTATAVLPAKPV
jgi:hypothetical protein